MTFLDEIRNKPVRFGVGLMSGTSCDGVDAALVRFKGSGPDLRTKLMAFTSIPYTPGMRTRLLATRRDAREIALLNFDLGERLAEAAQAVIDECDDAVDQVDFVASHGHTIAHCPPLGGDNRRGTLQIGEAAVIAERTGLPVVSDFRTRDMAAGGQGAPLVPYADWTLFHRDDRTSVCLNIGGIANVTVVTPKYEDVIAFDTGPGNMIIDGTMELLTKGSQHMDYRGQNAATGMLIDEFLDYLLDHAYFALAPPKSAGREQFGPETYLRDALAARQGRGLDDLVATVTAAVAYSIARAYNRYIAPRYDVARLIISGGGVHNRTLMDLLEQRLPDVVIRRSDQYKISSDAREALAFAILGNETLCGQPANAPGATGASHPVVLGKITPP